VKDWGRAAALVAAGVTAPRPWGSGEFSPSRGSHALLAAPSLAPAPTRAALRPAPHRTTPPGPLLCRQIDRAGGLDRYLVRTPDKLLHSDVGSDLKFRIGLIMKQRWYEEAAARRRDATAAALGIEAGGTPGARLAAGGEPQGEQQQQAAAQQADQPQQKPQQPGQPGPS
jgi:hypothetical protein